VMSLGQLGAVPWSYHPAWFLLVGMGVPALTWLGFAWQRALNEDPHRLRRAGLRELRRLLARMRRSGSLPGAPQLHGWCRAAARTWGVRVSAPTGPQVVQSVQSFGAKAQIWQELWSATERSLYAAETARPPDWVNRASSAALAVAVPRRERWLPNRLAHWLPSAAAAVLLVLAVGAGAARADQTGTSAAPADPAAKLAPPGDHPLVSAMDERAAVNALHRHWNDWAAHYNLAAGQVQEGNWNYAVAHATSAFLLHPASAANRDTLRFAIQQAGTMDPTLRRLLYGAWFQRYPALLSPAGWQRIALGAGVVLAGGLTALVLGLYVPHRRRTLATAGRNAAAAGVLVLMVAIGAFNAYGPLSRPTAGILLEGVNLSPSPTELVPERETSPATAGSVVLPVSDFLGWRQVVGGTNISGWVRGNAVMPLYESSRR
jgi:hypothetical protein